MVPIGKLWLCGMFIWLGFGIEHSGAIRRTVADDALLARLKQEAPLAWKRNSEAQDRLFNASNFEVEIRSQRDAAKSTDIDQKKMVQETVVRIDKDHRSYLRNESNGEGTLVVFNPAYSFELRRASLDSQWSLAEVYSETNNPGVEGKRPSGTLHNWSRSKPDFGQPPNISELYPFHSALDQLDLNELEIRSATTVSVDGRDLVRVEFGSPYEVLFFDPESKRSEKRTEIADAYVLLDPNLSWAVIEFFASSGKDPAASTKWSAKHEYEKSPAGMIYRSKTWYHADQQPSPISNRYEWAFGQHSQNSDTFYLTHYGFPEPDFYTPPWPWWLYASAAGVGLVLIGVLLVQLGRRLRRRS